MGFGYLDFDMIETAYGETNLESDKNTLHVKYDSTITRQHADQNWDRDITKQGTINAKKGKPYDKKTHDGLVSVIKRNIQKAS